ncbi:uncharacterized protein [Temnothorax nylanderi]|uniref:uncharacterized protein n=1 Tax=Temnothorax nylanderi TaxID=102681 RepID=UPI003A89FE23
MESRRRRRTEERRRRPGRHRATAGQPWNRRGVTTYNSAVAHRPKGRPTSGTASTSHGHGGGSYEGGEGQSDCGGRRNASFPFPERGQRRHFHESRRTADSEQHMRREEFDGYISAAG